MHELIMCGILACKFLLMKPIYLLFALVTLIASPCFSQSYELSDPIDLPNSGYYKVLQMSNGNTMLFHMEARKAIRVRVFDTNRKLIAQDKFSGGTVDPGNLESSDLHGIYEINNEGVIFISQSINNLNILFALRFSANTGKLIKEEELIRSETYKKKNTYSLVRHEKGKGYAVFCMKDLEANFKEEIFLETFDETHKSKLHLPVSADLSEYDYVSHLSTTNDKHGRTIVTLKCKKIIHYPDEMEHYLMVCYLPADQSDFTYSVSKLPIEVSPYYSMFTYNEFSKMLHVYLVNAMVGTIKNGLQEYQKIFYNNYLLRYNEYNLADMRNSALYHTKANKLVKEIIDTTAYIDPVPIKAYTNRFGKTTLISEENEQKIVLNNQTTGYSLIGSIVVTQINDKGNEIWSTIIPKRQILKNGLTSYKINQRGKHKQPFRYYDPTSDWLYQMASYSCMMTKRRNCYIIYNDCKSNFDKTFGDNIDTVTTYTDKTNLVKTDAVVYKITGKRDVSKRYLLEGTPEDISSAAMVEGADFSEDTNTYATVLLQTLHDKGMLRLGWFKLEE